MKKNKIPSFIAQKETQKALHYIETLVDLAREPFLILNQDLRIINANESFYQTFRASKKTTEGKFIYNLGNKQWNIPKLKKLLEQILPQKKVIRDFEVSHKFPKIGQRIILLNGHQIDSVQLIILCFNDVTQIRKKEKTAQAYTQKLEATVARRTKQLQTRVKDLEELTEVMVGRELKMSELKKEIARVKKLKKLNHNNGNGNHGLFS